MVDGKILLRDACIVLFSSVKCQNGRATFNPPSANSALQPWSTPNIAPHTRASQKYSMPFTFAACSTCLLTEESGNQPPKSQSPPLPTRIRSPQQRRPRLPQTLLQQSHLQQPRRRPEAPLLLHHSRRHFHTTRCTKHHTGGEARRLSPPGRDPTGEEFYKVRRVRLQ